MKQKPTNLLLDITGHCHSCGKPGLPPRGQPGRVVGVPWCSARCERSAKYKAGDMVVLDSGYTNDVNGLPFRVKEELGEGRFRASVRGQTVEFIREQACKVGTKRAEAIINKRKLFIAKQGVSHGKSKKEASRAKARQDQDRKNDSKR